MSSLVVTESQPIPASILAGGQLSILPHPAHPLSLRIDLPDFEFHFATSVSKLISEEKPQEVIIEFQADKQVSLSLCLTGRLTKGAEQFDIEQALINIDKDRTQARADFVASTLWAAFTLVETVFLRIPKLELDLNLKFDLPLLEISKLLQTRQTDYRLMVIEQATGRRFNLPDDFSGSEMEAIIFTYRAIVDRSFAWPVKPQSLVRDEVSAMPENLARLFPDSGTLQYETSAMPLSQTVLGEEIPLGIATAVIEDFFIQNADDVRRELAKCDGHVVELFVGSKTGRAIFNFPEAPRLPDSPWDSNIQTLIDLESKLDARLCERYNALAASTLEGLTEEQKAAVTARPDLDWGSFLGGNEDGDDA